MTRGDYSVEVWSGPTSRDKALPMRGAAPVVHFAKDYGANIVQNLYLEALAADYTNSLRALVLGVNDDFADPLPVPGVSVVLSSPKGQMPTATTDRDGLAFFSSLKHGAYKLKVLPPSGFSVEKGDEEKNIYFSGSPDPQGTLQMFFLYADSAVSNCVRHPQQNVQEFFFCGEKAIQLYQDRMSAWAAIDQMAGTLPHQL